MSRPTILLPVLMLCSLYLISCKKQTSKVPYNTPVTAPDPVASKGTPVGKGTGTGAPPNRGQEFKWNCGNGSCESGAGEDCIVCPKDCGRCDGCQVKKAPLCPSCKCERCVCKKVPRCCARDGTWNQECVTACKETCGGCGL